MASVLAAYALTSDVISPGHIRTVIAGAHAAAPVCEPDEQMKKYVWMHGARGNCVQMAASLYS